jgi:hypothetical protein
MNYQKLSSFNNQEYHLIIQNINEQLYKNVDDNNVELAEFINFMNA